MNYALEVMKIVEGAVKLDRAKVINYTSLLADKLDEDGEKKTADRLRKIIIGSKTANLQPTSVEAIYRIPVDQESRLPMADIFNPMDIDDFIVLNKDTEIQIQRFLDYYTHSDKIISSGLTVPNSILMYGPPGCGKTVLAKVVGKKLGLSVVIARLDGLISSFLGSTSKNIRAVFDYAQKVPCVLFLDEFDAIAKVRDDNHELGELKRVVNSLLQNIDALKNGSIIIAATNHEHLLDPAVWRRFVFKLPVEKPDYNARIELVKYFLREVTLPENDLSTLGHLFKGLTGAGIEEICKKARMDAVIKDEKVKIYSLVILFVDYMRFFKNEDGESLSERDVEKAIAGYLRNLNPKIFSYSCIARMLNRSKTHIANLLKG
ncbi:MAG: hypothetical protein VR69_03095 [Peptococcaceae bacterium BRH_c4b]|nr:MAG: hypothetical protein VR69_03095 [Peptococcaceae bacterium BRH_c4b]